MRLTAVLLLAVASVLSPPEPVADEPAAPQWYKGNTHTHTLWSDGNDFPEMVVDWYRKNGYHFLALSDHNVLSRGDRWMETAVVRGRAKGSRLDPVARLRARFGDKAVKLRTRNGREQIRLRPLKEVRRIFEKRNEFLMVEGEEITDKFKTKQIHINALNLAAVIEPRHGDSVRETIANNLTAVIQQVRRFGRPVLAHLNHANFHYSITAEDIAAVSQLGFFEVYNGHPSINHEGDEIHAGDERIWDIANTIRIGDMKERPVYGIATDDSHAYHGLGGATPGRGWIQVRADRLTPGALLSAMDKGDFYSSSGVDLTEVEYDRGGRTLTVAVRPKAGDTYTIRFIGTLEGTNRTGAPVVNANGVTLRVTRRYGEGVGAVLLEVKGTRATYRLSGRELFVRAHVVSSRPHPNASVKGQVEEAWTQPVGWERRVR